MEDTNLWIFKNEFCQKVHESYLYNVVIIILVWIEIKFIVLKKWNVQSATLFLQRNMFIYVCAHVCIRFLDWSRYQANFELYTWGKTEQLLWIFIILKYNDHKITFKPLIGQPKRLFPV